MSYRSGLDRFRDEVLPEGRAGILTHYAAVNSDYSTCLDVVSSDDRFRLTAVFGPQHGFHGETQDNMIEWRSYTHKRYGIPVYSLYGEVREPDTEMLGDLDCFIVDLQDVGARYYTYIYTMALCMRKCAMMDIPVVVLDRPNPLGLRIIEGKNLNSNYTSFVGMYPIPVRHALTIGELAVLFSRMDCLPAPQVLQILNCPLDGFPDNAPWVFPSPNMPTADTAHVYPGMCLLEGTNLSEGRGTTRPFEVFGAPWIDGEDMADRLNGSSFMEGAIIRPHSFIPTFNKHAGKLCNGGQIHITDLKTFRSMKAALGILVYCFEHRETGWKNPPYEYEYRRMPVDILTGGTETRLAVEGRDNSMLLELSEGDPVAHSEHVGEILLYAREFVK